MKLRTLLYITAAALIAVSSAVLGAAIERTRDAAVVADYRASPVAIVAVSVCAKQEGAVVITGDGVIHSELGLSAAESIAIAKALPQGHGIEFAIPCQDPRT